MVEYENGTLVCEPHAGCQVFCKCTLDDQSKEQCFTRALKSVQKRVAIPGFRKGHAPHDILLKRYPADMEHAWKHEVCSLSLELIEKKTPYTPLNTVKNADCSSWETEPVQCQMQFEHYPLIPSLDFTDFNPTPFEPIIITEESIDSTIQYLRQRNASYTPLDKDQIEPDDYVEVTLFDIQQNRPIVDHQIVHLKDQLPQEIIEVLLTLRPGQSADVTLGNPRIDARATFHAIHSIHLPEIDDALAASIGASTVEEMRTIIAHVHYNEIFVKRLFQTIEELNQFFIQNYSFELPKSLVKNAIESLQQDKALSEELIQEKAQHHLLLEFLYQHMAIQERLPRKIPHIQLAITKLLSSESLCSLLHIEHDPKTSVRLAKVLLRDSLLMMLQIWGALYVLDQKSKTKNRLDHTQ